MSARDGEKSGFNRKRNRRSLRGERTHELLERLAKSATSADFTVPAQAEWGSL